MGYNPSLNPLDKWGPEQKKQKHPLPQSQNKETHQASLHLDKIAAPAARPFM